ncbi:MAG: helix-turn-helix domain-containing protein [Rhodoferax sp.]
MSDTVEQGTSFAAANMLHTPSPDTAGAMLRRAREAAGMHIGVLAAAIKIPAKKLEALEADALHETHDLVFTRALASSVCRTLRMDPRPVLAALPQSGVRELHVDDHGINAPFTRPQGIEGVGGAIVGKLAKPAVVMVLALLLGAAAMVLSAYWSQDEEVAHTEPGGEPAQGQPVPLVIPAPAQEATAAPAHSTGPAAVAMATAVPSPALDAPVTPGNAAASVAAQPASAVTTPAPDATAGAVVLTLKARAQPVWVEVVDARGDIRVRRTLAAGERLDTSGAYLPWSVVVGKVDAVEVLVRGKALDLAAQSRDNVARFEVR